MSSVDISRIIFDRARHYKAVLMQQGRVLTDNDYNEGSRMLEYDLDRSRVDIIGPFGSPDDGFSIDDPKIVKGQIEFSIIAGVIYLGGWRLELEKNETYRTQKDWLQLPASQDPAPALADKPRYDLVYIEAWQQPVVAVEDDSLFEVALSGPDTTGRLRTMRRVHLKTDVGTCSCMDAWDALLKDKDKIPGAVVDYRLDPGEQLKVDFAQEGLSKDLCTPSVAGGYLGAENQAIRVQLVDDTHFTWGFDNASSLYRVTVSADGKTITFLTEPRDQYHWPLSRQVVEVLPWGAILSNNEKTAELTGHLTKVAASYDPDARTLTLEDPVPATLGKDWQARPDQADVIRQGLKDQVDQAPAEYFFLRVWNRGDDLDSPAKIDLPAATPITLGHTGVRVSFTGNDRVPGDFWVIAARPESPDVIVPWELENGTPPHGHTRYFAPLGIIRWQTEGGQIKGDAYQDCRKKFGPLTRQDCCCTYSVGDGVTSHGDYDSLEKAIASLPAQGGRICVLPGEHYANISISGGSQITISGCGEQSIIRPGTNQPKDPIIHIEGSQKINIQQLTLVSMEGIALEVVDGPNTKNASQKITIRDNNIIALEHAVLVQAKEAVSGNAIEISYNRIGMLDMPGGDTAIFAKADEVLIERNHIVVVPQPDSNDPEDPRGSDPNGGIPFDPCAGKSTLRPGSIRLLMIPLLKYILLYRPTGLFRKEYQAMGGIQIGSGSERVMIRLNEITGGNNHGIVLGGLSNVNADVFKMKVGAVGYTYSALYDISIEENTILQMGLSGISAFQVFADQRHLVHIDGITIFRNQIRFCARSISPDILAKKIPNLAFGGIILQDTQNATIEGNVVRDNGRGVNDPICGIFILYGEKIGISGNMVVNEPVFDRRLYVKGAAGPATGARGGIVVKMAFQPAQLKTMLLSDTPSFDGIPAVTVYDNIVNQPVGHALYLTSFGPVSVIANQLTSQGIDRTNPFSEIAAAVFILDLGFSKDLLAADFRTLSTTTAIDPGKLTADSPIWKLLLQLEYLPSGKVMFADNQVTLDLRSATNSRAVSSTLIATLDDVTYSNNQSECAGFLSLMKGDISYDFVLVNSILYGITVRANGNRFQDGFTLTFYSLLSIGRLNTAVGNQATHCMIVLGNLLSDHHNIVLYSDPCERSRQLLSDALKQPPGKDFA